MPSKMGASFVTVTLSLLMPKKQETLRSWLSANTITETKAFLKLKNSSSENPIKPTGFENSPKCSSSCLFLLVLVVSGLHKQADFVHIFLQKIAFTGDTMVAS